MVMSTTSVLYVKCDSQTMVLAVVFTFNSLGTICVGYLIYSRAKNNDMNLTTKNTFLKIKLISMYIFGIGYMYHCALYIWKHLSTKECPDKTINVLGVLFNAISIIFTFILFLYFSAFYVRRRQNTFKENAATLIILIANLCIWLDALFSDDPSKNSHQPSTTNTTEPQVMTVIKKTDIYLSPAMIEFSLMAIDLLFTITNDSLEDSSPDISGDVESNNTKKLIKRSYQIFFSLAAFVLFAFTYTVVLSSDNEPNASTIFNVYVAIQLTLKLIMFFSISISLFFVWPFLTFHFNIWAFVLIVTLFGNIVYHMLYCFAIHYVSSNNSTKYQDNDIENVSIQTSWADNIISIVLAGFQTLFILGFHSPRNHESLISVNCKHFVYYSCSLLGVLNLGLWISDSIGEERLPDFSLITYDAFKPKGWLYIQKIVLPLTIFFRFHSGIDFLELYWKHRHSEN